MASQEVAPALGVSSPTIAYTFLGTKATSSEAARSPYRSGPADERHLKAIAAAIKGERLAYILVTHSHRDHRCRAAREIGGHRRVGARREAPARRVSAMRCAALEAA